MRQKKMFLNILGSIPIVALIILNLVDIFNVYVGSGGYPFGSDFFGPASIYSSKTLYISYQIVFTLFLIITIFFLFKSKWIWFLVFLFCDIILFFYPMLTNT